MSADDLLRAMLSTLPTRQLRRGRIRQWNRVLARRAASFAPESLESRSMMSTTSGDLATTSLAGVEPAAYAATVAVPRTFTITWAWNENRTLADFNPQADVLALDWFSGSELRLAEEAGSAVLRIPSMQQSYRLAGVPLASLTRANFTCKDPSATAFIADTLAAPVPTPTPTPTPTPAPTPSGRVQFKVTTDWGSGFNGDVTVRMSRRPRSQAGG